MVLLLDMPILRQLFNKVEEKNMNHYIKFTECCQKANINIEQTFAFASRETTQGRRIRCKSPYRKRNENQLFVIYYDEMLKLYFAWSLKVVTAPKKTCFSANIDKMSAVNEYGIMTILKRIAYPGNPKEIVRVFDDNHIINFLQSMQIEIK